jgi:hypothetical protein
VGNSVDHQLFVRLSAKGIFSIFGLYFGFLHSGCRLLAIDLRLACEDI